MRKKGHVVLDLAPTQGNPRNSEGAFIELRDGRLMFAYSKYIGESPEDDATSCIAAMYSTDGGESWAGQRDLFFPQDESAINLMSVSLLRMGNGDLGIFYMVRRHINDLQHYFRRSADEGQSWSEPICCMPSPGYFVTNNDRVIKLSNGKIVIPSAMRRARGGDPKQGNSGRFGDVKGIVHFFASDDDGYTWRAMDQFHMLMAPHSKSGLQEPGIIELSNGVLWSWSRTDMGRQYEMYSTDQGETWSIPTPSQFTSPNSPLSMKRIPQTNELLAIWNPVPIYPTRKLEAHSWGRVPMVGALSNDEGKTWDRYFYVESEEDRGGYCYTSIHVTDEAVLLAYCAGEPEDGTCLARLRIRKINISDL